MTSISHKKNCR